MLGNRRFIEANILIITRVKMPVNTLWRKWVAPAAQMIEKDGCRSRKTRISIR